MWAMSYEILILFPPRKESLKRCTPSLRFLMTWAKLYNALSAIISMYTVIRHCRKYPHYYIVTMTLHNCRLLIRRLTAYLMSSFSAGSDGLFSFFSSTTRSSAWAGWAFTLELSSPVVVSASVVEGGLRISPSGMGVLSLSKRAGVGSLETWGVMSAGQTGRQWYRSDKWRATVWLAVIY